MRGVRVPDQRINLYQREPGRQAGLPLQEKSFALVAGAGLVLLILGYLLLQVQINGLQDEHAQLTGEVARYRQQLQQLKAKVPPAEADPVLVAELQRLQVSRSQVSQAITLIEQHRTAAGAGFAELFRSLARHPVEGLWLQDVRMADNGEEFVLRGQALQAALVPRLLRSLGDEAVFNGRTFREVRFERPANGESGALNFELRSRREDADAG